MLNDLVKFKTVVELGSVTKASKELNISQPAITLSIKNLEKLLDTELLERTKQGVKPTTAGELIYEDAKIASSINNSVASKIAEIKGQSSREIRIGMIDSYADYFVKNLLNQVSKSLTLELYIDNTANLIKYLDSGLIDIGIITKTDLPTSLRSRKLLTEKLILVGSQRYKIKKKPNFITYNKNSNTYELIDQALRLYYQDYSYVIKSSSPEVILSLTLNNVGIGILPEAKVADLISKKKLKIVNSKFSIRRELLLVDSKYNYIDKNLKSLINLMLSS